jgi:hypothetical protein
MDKVMAYSCDAFVGGTWKIVCYGSDTSNGAIDTSIDYMYLHFPHDTHFHVWQNGSCIFDSHEGQPEPENEG